MVKDDTDSDDAVEGKDVVEDAEDVKLLKKWLM